jgi:hypothetical protein
MKKILVSALIAAMVLGLGSVAFGAAGAIAPAAFSDIAGHKAEAELTLFAALGVFTGSSGLGGAVKPDDAITRAEFSKVIVLATGRGSTAAGLAGLRPTYTDEIPAWAWGYVNVASYMGVIGGYPDGTFKAGAPLTYAEAVTMLVRATPGHKAQVGAGVWPYNFLFYAVDNHFTGAVDVGFAALPCTRGDMARLLFATMQVDPLNTKGEADADGALLESTGATPNLFEGACTGYGGGGFYIGGDVFALADPVYLVGADSYEDLFCTDLLAVKKGTALVFLQKTEGKAITGTYRSYAADILGNWFIKLVDGTKVPFVPSVDVVLNQVDGHTEVDLVPGDELTINTDANGNAASVFALRWDLANEWVGSVYQGVEDYVTAFTKSSSTTDTLLDVGWDDFVGHDHGAFGTWLYETHISVPKTAKVTINGKTAGRDDLAESDVIKGATLGADGYAHDIIAIAATRAVAQGTVIGTSTTFPGDHRFVTLKTGDVSKTYERAAYTYGGGAPTGLNKFALNAAGELFYNISFASANPIVRVTGASTETTGSTTKYFLTADVKGVSQTFATDDDASGLVGTFQILTIDGATGVVTGHGEVIQTGSGWEIVAIGADSVTLVVGGNYQFVANPLVYRKLGSAFTFIGLGGLAVGDFLDIYGDFAILVRDDTP